MPPRPEPVSSHFLSGVLILLRTSVSPCLWDPQASGCWWGMECLVSPVPVSRRGQSHLQFDCGVVGMGPLTHQSLPMRAADSPWADRCPWLACQSSSRGLSSECRGLNSGRHLPWWEMGSQGGSHRVS